MLGSSSAQTITLALTPGTSHPAVPSEQGTGRVPSAQSPGRGLRIIRESDGTRSWNQTAALRALREPMFWELSSCRSELWSFQRGCMDSAPFQKGVSTFPGSEFPGPGQEEGALALSLLQSGVHPKESGRTNRQVLYVRGGQRWSRTHLFLGWETNRHCCGGDT